jgi:hypothetical protein
MIWIEVVCDGCNNNLFGETYRSNSVSRIKKEAREAGWKTIKGKIYCTECQERMKSNKNP